LTLRKGVCENSHFCCIVIRMRGTLTSALSPREREPVNYRSATKGRGFSPNRWEEPHAERAENSFEVAQSASLSARIFLYASRATSKAFLAASFSDARMAGPFLDQHWSTDLRHHSADFLDARIGLPPTVMKTGLVWEDG
jgi:hypothetical protein